MNKSVKFLNNYYDKAVKLSNDFSITRNFEWTPLLILNELHIQVGHIYNVVYKSKAVNEIERDFNDIGDELSDVLLQLIALSDSMNINLFHIKNLNQIKEDNCFSLPILLGQLNEAIMEKYGYRFPKKRIGFETIEPFIENRILRIFDITCQIADKYKLNIEREFSKMLDDANNFLERFSSTHKVKDFIDTYNENHDYIGSFEKDKAHQLLLWHDVVGCMIFNPNSKKIFFQLKNHEHNNVKRTTSWKGLVGLMSPTDYGYATSGASTTNRESCLNTILYNWAGSEITDCKNNAWLYNSSFSKWTMMPSAYSSGVSDIFYLNQTGYVTGHFSSDNAYRVHPVVYLKANTKIISGDGTLDNMFVA